MSIKAWGERERERERNAICYKSKISNKNNVFYRLIFKLDISEKRITELENIVLETCNTENQTVKERET
jgi:hypothetical protein